jgi:hypothetical protein
MLTERSKGETKKHRLIKALMIEFGTRPVFFEKARGALAFFSIDMIGA